MEKLVEKIMSIRGVIGCYIYGLTQGIQAGQGNFDGQLLKNISREISQMIDAFVVDKNKPKAVCVSYEMGKITIKRASDLMIVVFHEPKIDMPLLRIAINVASHEIKKRLRK